jgi:glycosyltransferase involved in cell wall biosynthesis
MSVAGRIVFVFEYGLVAGGTESWALDLAEQLAQRDYQPVLALYPLHPGTQAQNVISPAIKRLPMETPKLFQISAVNLAQLAGELPAVVIPNNCVDAYAACAKLSETHKDRLRILGYCHGISPLLIDLICRFEAIIHTIVAVSEECRNTLVQRLPHRANDIIERPCSIMVPGTLTREYSRPGEPLKLIYAGRIEQRLKQVLGLVDLARALGHIEVDFTLRIIGEGPSRPELARDIAGLPASLRARIALEPGMPNSAIPGVLQQHDVAVQVSNSEGTSLFMLEALAAGCVPVMTRVSGTKKVITEEVNGFTVPVADYAQMAQVIRRLALDRERLSRMGKHAFASAAPYSRERYLPWFLDIIAEAWRKEGAAWPADRSIFPPHLTFLSRCADYLPGSMKALKYLRSKLGASR